MGFEETTVYLEPKDDPRDRLEVEIGDAKQPEFLPRVKIKRWDNEVNASMGWLHSENQLSIEQTEDLIAFRGSKTEAYFYELPDSEKSPEGAIESEIVLLEKPVTDKVIFSLNDKDVKYHHQPALTREEIERGCIRPEHVVDSYAIYAASEKINYQGGKLYQACKVGHLYRPRIEDAAKNWVWGGHEIKDGKRIVTIPEQFLRDAVYPIRHAAGATFGFTSVGGSSFELGNAGVNMASKANPGLTTDVDKITYYGKVTSGSTNFKGCIWKSSDLSLVTNSITSPTLVNSTTAQWWDTALYGTKPSVTAQDYLVGFVGEGTLLWGYYDFISGEGGYGINTGSYAAPSSFGQANNGFKTSVYATYTAAAAANTGNFLLMF